MVSKGHPWVKEGKGILGENRGSKKILSDSKQGMAERQIRVILRGPRPLP